VGEHKGNQYTENGNMQNLHNSKTTADKLAEQHSVSPRTIHNDAKFTKAVDTIGKASPEAKQKILSGKGGVSKGDVAQIAELPYSVPRKTTWQILPRC